MRRRLPTGERTVNPGIRLSREQGQTIAHDMTMPAPRLDCNVAITSPSPISSAAAGRFAPATNRFGRDAVRFEEVENGRERDAAKQS